MTNVSVGKKRDTPKTIGVIKPATESKFSWQFQHKPGNPPFRTSTKLKGKCKIGAFQHTTTTTITITNTTSSSGFAELTMLHIKLTAKTAKKFDKHFESLSLCNCSFGQNFRIPSFKSSCSHSGVPFGRFVALLHLLLERCSALVKYRK